MQNTYWFNVREHENMIRNDLFPYLGLEAKHCNFYQLVEMMLENYFYGSLGTDLVSMSKRMESYGVPAEESEEIVLNTKNKLILMIQSVMGAFDDADVFEIEVHPNGDLLVTRLSGYVGELTEEETISQIREGIENGDYYPEHLHRLAYGK